MNPEGRTMPQTEPKAPGSRPTPTIEDYLAVIYVMERDGEEVIAARLAESLEVAPPTVTVTLKRMERDGWIFPARRQGIHLTEEGHRAACSVIRRHMLTEWMLARVLNIPWSRIHAEAHHMEHAISEEIENQMRMNLDDPHLCPHGNPLPGFEHITADWLPLTEVEPGEMVTIQRIHELAEDKPDLMKFLDEQGIHPGVQAQLVERMPFNQTVTLLVGERRVVLGYSTARYVFIGKLGR
jgi:DtxR family Mn-dependent transcriptional regulator